MYMLFLLTKLRKKLCFFLLFCARILFLPLHTHMYTFLFKHNCHHFRPYFLFKAIRKKENTHTNTHLSPEFVFFNIPHEAYPTKKHDERPIEKLTFFQRKSIVLKCFVGFSYFFLIEF